MAAPIASQILGEVLPYLQVQKNEESEDEIKKVIIPNVVGLKYEDAKQLLEEHNLTIDDSNIIDKNGVITEQIPVPKVEVFENSKIIVK